MALTVDQLQMHLGVPGWAASTSRSRSTTGGVHRAGATLTTTGPCGPVGQVGQGQIGDDQLDACRRALAGGPSSTTSASSTTCSPTWA